MKLGQKHIVAALALASSGSFFCACGDSNVEITSPHRIRKGVDAPRTGATEAQRFGMRPASQAASQPTTAELFEWSTPEGWQSLPPNQYRWINFKVGQVECSFGNITAGVIPMNINRWRKQMGAEELSEASIEGLKLTRLLGLDAYRMDVDGSYTSMSGSTIDDARMLTVIADFPNFALTVKMTGPRAEVEAQADNFAIFVSSLAFNTNATGGAAGADDHSGHNHAPGEGHAEPAQAGPAAPSELASQLAWEAPAGWEDAGARSMRHVTFNTADNPGVEAYITLLPGRAGSVIDNLNRWLGQVGLEHLDQPGVDALPSITLLGQQAGLLEAIGDTSAIIATQLANAEGVMFVKMTGSPAGVLAEKENFISFCNSLRND